MIFNREPALFLGAIHAIIALAIGFGLDVTIEQFALIEVAVAAVVSFIVRSRVTPTAQQ
jgi:hypothetical protein